MNLKDKAKVVAEFPLWANAARKFIDEDTWTKAREEFVQTRFAFLTKLEGYLSDNGYRMSAGRLTNEQNFRVVGVERFRGDMCYEFVHIILVGDKVVIMKVTDRYKAIPVGDHTGKFVWSNQKGESFKGMPMLRATGVKISKKVSDWV